MKRLVILLVFVIAGLAVFGFARGWFHVAAQTEETQSNVTVSVDKAKIQQDKDAAADKAKDLTQKAEDKTAAAIPAK